MKNKNLKKAIFIVLFGLIFLMLNSNESKAMDEYTFHFDQVTYKYSEVNEILTEINNMRTEAGIQEKIQLDPILMQIAKERVKDCTVYNNYQYRPDGTYLGNGTTEVTQYAWYGNFYDINLKNFSISVPGNLEKYKAATSIKSLYADYRENDKWINRITDILDNNYNKELILTEDYKYAGICIVYTNGCRTEYIVLAKNTIPSSVSIPTSDVVEKNVSISINKSLMKFSLFKYDNSSTNNKENVCEGDTKQLTIYYPNKNISNGNVYVELPSKDDYKQVAISITDSRYATVTDTGLLSFISYTSSSGVTVYVGNTSIIFIVAKYNPITKIELNKTSIDMYTNSNREPIIATITPSDTTQDSTITWSVENDSILELLYETGRINYIKQKSPGTTKITAKTSNGLTASCIVNVIDIPIEKIEIEKEIWIKYLKIAEYNALSDEDKEEKYTLHPAIFPSNTTHPNIKYEVINDPENGFEKYGYDEEFCDTPEGAIQRLYINNDTGLMRPLGGESNQKVKVYSEDNPEVYTYIVVHIVNEIIPITGITLNKSNTTIEVGKTDLLTVSIQPNNYTADGTITWTSSDTSTAIVDNDGKITAKKEGEVIITATTSNGKTATCKIKVIKNETTDYLIGDVNGDGKVNGKDWIRLYEHISETNELTGEELKRADVNGDGKVNGKDWIRLYEHINESNPLF